MPHVPAITLEDGATIVVIGGGPAGSFFAIEALQHARELSRTLNVLIVEQKKQSRRNLSSAELEGCNYCAGGISPRLAEILEKRSIRLPSEIIQSEVSSITVQGNWKHIELRVPDDRKIYSVYRGARPQARVHRYNNLDSTLLECALEKGAKIINGQAYAVQRRENGKPVVYFRAIGQEERQELDADFIVLAGGVNQRAGMVMEQNDLILSLRELLPGFTPPKVRKALICELKCDEEVIRNMKGEMYFVEYGSKELEIEMSSFVPKDEGMITVALLGKSIDRARAADHDEIVRRFLKLGHVKRLFPKGVQLELTCSCFPNMTIGSATKPFGDRAAVIGDLAVSRLYKDGIFSAYKTASALARCVTELGVDEASLRHGYLPEIEAMTLDNSFGRLVFYFSRFSFSQPWLSRIFYQAVFTERKTKGQEDRLLEKLLWKVASGDDDYRNIYREILSWRVMQSLAIGGLLVTVRNYLTELFFGLRWRDVGRYPTGVYRESVEVKRRSYLGSGAVDDKVTNFDFERMYSIKIKARKEAILEQLAAFGEPEMEYFRPRLLKIRTTHGKGLQTGKTIRYDTPLPFLNFSIELDCPLVPDQIVYRVLNGYAEGGVLVFEIEEVNTGVFVLSIYVAFDFPKGAKPMEKLYWKVFKLLFPKFVHDVLWNYSLCSLKGFAEEN